MAIVKRQWDGWGTEIEVEYTGPAKAFHVVVTLTPTQRLLANQTNPDNPDAKHFWKRISLPSLEFGGTRRFVIIFSGFPRMKEGTIDTHIAIGTLRKSTIGPLLGEDFSRWYARVRRESLFAEDWDRDVYVYKVKPAPKIGIDPVHPWE